MFTQGGLSISGHINIPVFGRADVSGTVQSNGSFSLSGNNDLSPFGLRLSQTSITVTDAGLRIRGNLNVLLGSTAIDTVVNPNGTFQSTSNANLAVAGTTLTNSTVTLSHNGARINSRAALGGTSIDVSGNVSGAGVNLTGSTGVNIPITTPRVCIPNCWDTFFGRVCGPEICSGGDNIGNLGATVHATIGTGGASFSSSTQASIGGFDVQGNGRIRLNPPGVCATVGFPGVNTEFCVDL